jgi:hypothetical protein
MLPKDTALISDTIASKTKMLPTTIQNVDLSGLFLLRNAIMDNIKKSTPKAAISTPITVSDSPQPPIKRKPSASASSTLTSQPNAKMTMMPAMITPMDPRIMPIDPMTIRTSPFAFISVILLHFLQVYACEQIII